MVFAHMVTVFADVVMVFADAGKNKIPESAGADDDLADVGAVMDFADAGFDQDFRMQIITSWIPSTDKGPAGVFFDNDPGVDAAEGLADADTTLFIRSGKGKGKVFPLPV